ncbi:MAG: hypothetical protein LBN04_09470 [Oscillospiraceae bacterium]|jgi:NRPS condensation-like uncharacterized protein|nr:hypothetical protein [Oscillospiraceae bacterium]
MTQKPPTPWYPLDNAGKLYPAIATARWSSVFRLSAAMRAPVIARLLQQALDRVLPRFPAMAVRLRKGFFWYYFEQNPRPLPIQKDEGHPCMPFRFKANNGFLLRVLYDDRRISVEFFHSLADGAGAMVFLKTLVGEYLRLCGVPMTYGQGVLDPRKKPAPGEAEDAFLRMPLPRVHAPRRETRAYHLPGAAEPPHTLHLIAASMPYAALSERARALSVTVTEYLTAALIYAAYKQQQQTRGKLLPVRASVPVNMRRFFATQTLRNCSTYVTPGIDPRLGAFTFEEIAEQVHAYMRYAVYPKRLYAGIATNVASERNLFLRLCPLPIKNLAIHSVFRFVGDRTTTTTLSNLGRIDAPAPMMPHVERFEAVLGPAATPGCHAVLTTTRDTLLLTFTRNQRDALLPRETLRFLVAQGVPVLVESNQG